MDQKRKEGFSLTSERLKQTQEKENEMRMRRKRDGRETRHIIWQPNPTTTL